MAAVRGGHTKPELLIRKALHAAGFRYRLHAKNLPGRPDLVLAKYRATIFVNGCFWHGHDCPLFRMPATREEFWEVKIARNRARDEEVAEKLAAENWRQLTIWECALRGPQRLGLPAVVLIAAEWIVSEATACHIRGQPKDNAT